MRKRCCVILVAIGLGLLGLGCTRNSSSPADDALPTQAERTIEDRATALQGEETVATINGRSISRELYEDAIRDLLTRYEVGFAQMGQDVHEFLTGAEGRLRELRLEAAALEQLLIIELFEQEAEKRGISISSERIDELFDSQFNAYLQAVETTESAFAATLAEEGRTLDDFVEDGKRGARIQLMLEEVQAAVAGSVEATDEEVAAYFEEHRADYAVEERIRASHILLSTYDEAQEALESLEMGAEFSDVARARSTDTGSANKGGDLGWFARGELMDDTFDDAAFALDVGYLSGVVETRFGLHIILVTDRQEAIEPELADIEDQLRDDAERALAIERGADWSDQAYNTATVEVYVPLVAAQFALWEDEDRGLEAFKALFEADELDEPYLGYILGSIYESRMRAFSEAGDTGAAEAARVKALEAYKKTRERVTEDADVEQRIRVLEATSIP